MNKTVSIDAVYIKRLDRDLLDLLISSDRCADQIQKADQEEINVSAVSAEAVAGIASRLRELSEGLSEVLKKSEER